MIRQLGPARVKTYYAKVAGTALGERAFSAALDALETVRRRPAAGSPRLGQLCEIPSLRARRVPGFPMQWCYFERGDHVDVVRLLGDRQDIIAILGKSPQTAPT